MEHYAGIDVSLERSSVCVVEGSGKIVSEAKVASEPQALIGWFASLGLKLTRIGLEAGPLSQWLYAGMQQAGLPIELLETRHVRAAFRTMPVKTDRNDARGIAELMRVGWLRPVPCKSLAAQEVRAQLTARKLVQSKLFDVEMSLRGILHGFGLKVGPTTPKRFGTRSPAARAPLERQRRRDSQILEDLENRPRPAEVLLYTRPERARVWISRLGHPVKKDVLTDAATAFNAGFDQVQISRIQAQLREFREGKPMVQIVRSRTFNSQKLKELGIYLVKDGACYGLRQLLP